MTVTYRCSACGAAVYTCCEKDPGLLGHRHPFRLPEEVLQEYGRLCKECNAPLKLKGLVMAALMEVPA